MDFEEFLFIQESEEEYERWKRKRRTANQDQNNFDYYSCTKDY